MIKVINVISDTNIGGAGKCVLTFLKYCNKKAIEPVVIVPAGSLLIGAIADLGVRYIEIDAMAEKSLDLHAIKILKKIFQEEKPDIIHCHAAMSARIAGKLYGKSKIIYTRHSVFEPEKRISRGIGKFVNGCINNFTADKIIAVADAAKANLIQTGVSAKKIVVIKNGVEKLPELSLEEKLKLKSNYNVGEGEFLLGIVARLSEVKGHIYILEALKYLLDDGFKVKLLIAGTGDMEDAIRTMIKKLDIEGSVIMAGFLNDVTGIMNILDINLNASFGTEATSLSLLEGMSIGVSAVVSDFGGNPGVVKNGVNGYIFPKCDSHAMYEKIKLILSDTLLLSRLSKSSEKLYRKEFKAEIMTEKIEGLYKSVLRIKE